MHSSSTQGRTLECPGTADLQERRGDSEGQHLLLVESWPEPVSSMDADSDQLRSFLAADAANGEQ